MVEGAEQLPKMAEEVPVELKKAPTFTKVLQTEVNLYKSIPRGKNWKPFLLNDEPIEPELEVEIEGISWQQVASKRAPKRFYEDNFVRVKIVSPSNKHRNQFAFVTMGDITRLPIEKLKKNQEQQKPLGIKLRPRAAKSEPQAEIEEEIVQEEQQAETAETFPLPLRPGVRLFKDHPHPRTDKESKKARDEYLDETKDWETQGRIEISVVGNRKEVWANTDHWIKGKVAMLTSKDFGALNKNSDALLLGQEVWVSKGQATPKRT